MKAFRLICATPPALADPAIAIAADRAGATGILDLSFAGHGEGTDRAVADLERHARSGCGLKLDARNLDLVERLARRLGSRLRTSILIPCHPTVLSEAIRLLRGTGAEILLEATSHEQAMLAQELELDGVIAKGHEAGGLVQEETTFILVQRLVGALKIPVHAQGGIGLHTAPACFAAGAAGVVLDAQLLLARESSLPDATRAAIARMDGSETVCLGGELGEAYRVFARPGMKAAEDLARAAAAIAAAAPRAEGRDAWRLEVARRVGWGDPQRHVWLL